MAPTLQLSLSVRLIADVNDAIELEKKCFPEAELEGRARLVKRHKEAPELFYGAYTIDPTTDKKILVGYLCGAASSTPRMTQESIDKHDPEGSTLCVHTLCVDNTYRKQRVADQLIRELTLYILGVNKKHMMATNSQDKRFKHVVIMAHLPLIPFYEKYGFHSIGPSEVTLGPETWYEMKYDI
ncbi:hypothetical protein BDF19DRAFT_453333 [Syncephalis fuscata]|nr:hypothetical protein BDF19DRAFT_453333 [Syncephalis fuscata]